MNKTQIWLLYIRPLICFCFFVWWQLLSGVSVWQRRSLLLKLAGQTQLLEELAEISVDRLGAITSAADGGYQQKKSSIILLYLMCFTEHLICSHKGLSGVIFLASDLFFFLFLSLSSPRPRWAPGADDFVVRVQWVCRTFSHHTGQSVQTHEPVLYISAAGETPTQCWHRFAHINFVPANKSKVKNVSYFCLHQSDLLCFLIKIESLIWYVISNSFR